MWLANSVKTFFFTDISVSSTCHFQSRVACRDVLIASCSVLHIAISAVTVE